MAPNKAGEDKQGQFSEVKPLMDRRDVSVLALALDADTDRSSDPLYFLHSPMPHSFLTFLSALLTMPNLLSQPLCNILSGFSTCT